MRDGFEKSAAEIARVHADVRGKGGHSPHKCDRHQFTPNRPRLLCGAEEEEAVVNASRGGRPDTIPDRLGRAK